jgi:hypothetical protein
MARCSWCQKDLGMFEGKVQKNVDGQKMVFCTNCVGNWNLDRKNRMISALCVGGPPAVHFVISKTHCLDPEDTRFTMIGPLLFTDRAICFAQLGEHQATNPGFAFGLIGAAVGAAANSYNLKKAANEPEQMLGATSRSKFEDLVAPATRIIVIPRDSITDIRFKGNSVEIKKAGKSMHFSLDGDKREMRERLEPEINRYLQHS